MGNTENLFIKNDLLFHNTFLKLDTTLLMGNAGIIQLGCRVIAVDVDDRQRQKDPNNSK